MRQGIGVRLWLRGAGKQRVQQPSRVSDRQGGHFQFDSKTLFQDLLGAGAKIIWETEELRDPRLRPSPQQKLTLCCCSGGAHRVHTEGRKTYFYKTAEGRVL